MRSPRATRCSRGKTPPLAAATTGSAEHRPSPVPRSPPSGRRPHSGCTCRTVGDAVGSRFQRCISDHRPEAVRTDSLDRLCRAGLAVAISEPSGGQTCQTTSPGSQYLCQNTHHDLGARMQPSMFNVRVPLADHDEVFLMNTFTDAQLVVSTDVAALLDRSSTAGRSGFDAGGTGRPGTLADHGFVVDEPRRRPRTARRVLPRGPGEPRASSASPSSPRCSATSPATTASRAITATTTSTPHKMSLETAARVGGLGRAAARRARARRASC